MVCVCVSTIQNPARFVNGPGAQVFPAKSGLRRGWEYGTLVCSNAKEGAAIYHEHTFCRKDGSRLTLTVRDCVPEEVDAIMAMQDRVAALIPDPALYVYTSREDVAESMTEDYSFGAYLPDGTIVAYTILLKLRDTPRNLAHKLGYAPDYALRCATADGTWVDPDYRGYGIQYYFSRLKDGLARDMGALELLACTAPNNIGSLTSLTRNGYRIVDRQPLYGGYDRLILSKKAEPCL